MFRTGEEVFVNLTHLGALAIHFLVHFMVFDDFAMMGIAPTLFVH